MWRVDERTVLKLLKVRVNSLHCVCIDVYRIYIVGILNVHGFCRLSMYREHLLYVPKSASP